MVEGATREAVAPVVARHAVVAPVALVPRDEVGLVLAVAARAPRALEAERCRAVALAAREPLAGVGALVRGKGEAEPVVRDVLEPGDVPRRAEVFGVAPGAGRRVGDAAVE
jgi:hypothetical protein